MWPDGQIVCSVFGHLQQLKFTQFYKKFATVGSQILNKAKNGQNFHKVAKILPHCLGIILNSKKSFIVSVGKVFTAQQKQ